MFQTVDSVSPVKQQYIWMAEYTDYTSLSEFDFDTKHENIFHDIDKENLVRFGLIGMGRKNYFECFGGVMKLSGRAYDIVYVDGNTEYWLTGQNIWYRDIIQYKHAESVFNPLLDSEANTTILGFNFGYKIKYEISGVNFNFHLENRISNTGDSFLYIWLVANEDMNGKLRILKNNHIVDEFEAPMKKNIGGEIVWGLK